MIDVKPKDIDTTKHFFEAFGKREREVSARYIVQFCQARDEGWADFTDKDIDDYYSEHGAGDGFWMNGLGMYGIVSDNPGLTLNNRPLENPTYQILPEFVSRCYKSSPK